MRVLAFGEILWDRIEGNRCIGGLALNLIGPVCRLDAESSIISIAGYDDPGSDALDFLKSVGVDVSIG